MSTTKPQAACPRCQSQVIYDYTCHTYPGSIRDGKVQWLACITCDSAHWLSCQNESCDWSYTYGLNPGNPRSEQNEGERPEWLPQEITYSQPGKINPARSQQEKRPGSY